MALMKMTPDGPKPMKAAEQKAFLAEQASITAEMNAEAAKNQARKLLQESDTTILRCYEDGVSVPAEWRHYRAALRQIHRTGGGEIPPQPDYPPGV